MAGFKVKANVDIAQLKKVIKKKQDLIQTGQRPMVWRGSDWTNAQEADLQ